jgi:hypothetical protein
MKIVKTYSVWNGLEYMYIQQTELWNEILEIIQSIDAGKYLIKVQDNHPYYNLNMIRKIFQTKLLDCQWEKSTKKQPLEVTTKLIL